MCTAITYHTKDHYFGRNLDLEYSYEEQVVITPRNYVFEFRKAGIMKNHYAMIGMAYVQNDYPLYYEATNEKGLSAAGLNFPENAYYGDIMPEKDNVAPFELIPWILGQCATLAEVKVLLEYIQIADIAFSSALLPSPLHWIIADKEAALTVEAVRDGLKIYENAIGVLTNNPTFDYHMMNLNNYMHLSNQTPVNRFAKDVPLKEYSRGMGALGLPGDLSSASRFVRMAFNKLNSVVEAGVGGAGVCNTDAKTNVDMSDEFENASVGQFFHLLDSVAMTNGALQMPDGLYEKTIYSCCCNADRGIYYYITYENRQICAVDMWEEDLNGSEILEYPLHKSQNVMWCKRLQI